jgi:esterase/lipase superfamily enzyme
MKRERLAVLPPRDAILAGALLLACGLITVCDVAAEDTASTVGPACRAEGGVLVHVVNSSLQAGPTEIRVLLPDKLDENRKYPCLYLLPVEAGAGQHYGDGMRAARRWNLANRFQIICVLPTFSALPWYCDHPSDPTLQQESYFLRVVIPHVEAAYPVGPTASSRLLVGFSKSGWGAFSLLLRHPETFARAAAWDAPLMAAQPNRFGMGPIFETQENFDQYRLTSLVQQQASALRDSPRLIHLGYGNFRKDHVDFERLLLENDIPHQFHDGPQRTHDWDSGWLLEAVQGLLPSSE